jgi:hypothetical protein
MVFKIDARVSDDGFGGGSIHHTGEPLDFGIAIQRKDDGLHRGAQLIDYSGDLATPAGSLQEKEGLTGQGSKVLLVPRFAQGSPNTVFK